MTGQIRQLDGFSRFLLPPIFSDLQEAASVGPVIAINESSTFLDTIIISSGAQPMHMKLRLLTPEKLAELERFLEAVKTCRDSEKSW